MPLRASLLLLLGLLSGPLTLARGQEGSDALSRRASELRGIEDTLAASAEARRRLEGEAEALRADRAKLSAALVAASARSQNLEDEVRAIEARADAIAGSEAAIRRSLESRRGVIIEVLAALQRMGRRPPPAVLTRPDDVLAALRASMLLGTAVPELRGEAETLAADLAELVRLREAGGVEREALRRELQALGLERLRLASLVAARQRSLADVEGSVGGERDKAAALAAQARTLRELIERMEREASAAGKPAEDANRGASGPDRPAQDRFAAAAFRDPARLAPKMAFQEARGLLPRPVSGEVSREFGAPDGDGGSARGMELRARPRAAVSSPADGWIAFAGPFRSYGQLLIINAGGGYYLLLAGMERINVEVGQFVLAGEPVGLMGDGAAPRDAAAARALAGEGPTLYVEFRKDGGPIDPGPWWAKSQGEKAQGDKASGEKVRG